MVTERLYYEDAYIRTFTTKVLHNYKDENGRHVVILNRTAFYPTGGGQPHDIGTLNNIPVYDVEEVDGELRHYVESPIDSGECFAEIQWDRRFDHMQQHAGQHILSAAFEAMYGYKTISFHLGKDTCTIDLDIKSLTEDEATSVEEKANEIILENRPIETKWVTEEEAKQYPLRKAISATENIRLVIIPDFDYNGCGGTHPQSTGEVNAISILHWEKQKKNVRVHFVCGNRVRKQLHEKHRVIQQLNDSLNAPQEDLPLTATRLLDQQKQFEKKIMELKRELLDHEAKQLTEDVTSMSNYHFVKKIYTDKEMKELQFLAKNVVQNREDILMFLVSEKDDKLQAVCARGKAINVSMKDVVTQVLPKINGRGGGNEMIAQGGGDKLMTSEEFMENMLAILETMIDE